MTNIMKKVCLVCIDNFIITLRNNKNLKFWLYFSTSVWHASSITIGTFTTEFTYLRRDHQIFQNCALRQIANIAFTQLFTIWNGIANTKLTGSVVVTELYRMTDESIHPKKKKETMCDNRKIKEYPRTTTKLQRNFSTAHIDANDTYISISSGLVLKKKSKMKYSETDHEIHFIPYAIFD